MRWRIVAAVAALSGAIGCAGPDAGAVPLTIFAAASLEELVVDLGTAFARRRPIRIVYNFAGSNTLARQIEASPRAADVFLSADAVWIDRLVGAGALAADAARPFLGNRLAVIAHRDSVWAARDPGDLAALGFRRLALADPEAVPAGRYARGDLRQTHGEAWKAMVERVVPTLDVRAAVALVAADPDTIGIVYRTDAAADDRVRVLFELPPRVEAPIVYWAAVPEGARNPVAAAAFVDFLATPEARGMARDRGFLPPPAAAR